MIAPIRPTPTRPDAPTHGVVSARRALAAVFFSRSPRQEQQAPRISNLLAWAFVTAAIAVTTSYLARSAWWKIRNY